MIAAVIILAILTAGTILTAVFIIEKMGANIERLREKVRELEQKVCELEAKPQKKSKKEEKPLVIKPTIDEIELQNKCWTRIEEIDKEIEEVSRAAKRITYGIRNGLVKELNDYEKADLKELERQQKKLCQEREEIMETLENKAGEEIKEWSKKMK